MRRQHETGSQPAARAALACFAFGFFCACSQTNSQPHVEYLETSPLSAFQSPTTVGTAGQAAATSAGAAGQAAPSQTNMPTTPVGQAGTSATPKVGGSGGVPATTTGGAGMLAVSHAGAGGASGSTSMATAGTNSTDGAALTKLSFTVTTKSYSGKYAPKNVGVVWVEDTSGKYLYTLEYWGSAPNDAHLTRYSQTAGASHDYALSNPLLSLFGGSKYVVMPPPDVITGPTLTMHKSHSDTWNLKDSSGAVVPDGNYRVVVEMTEDEVSEKSQEVPFTKGPMAATVMQPDAATFTGMKLTLQ